jgi:hypothetical protein
MPAAVASQTVQEILAALRKASPVVASRYNARLIGVFGSFARGEQKNDSDVDVLVEFGSGSSLATVGAVLNYLEDLLGKKVDLADEASIRPLYKPLIYKDLIRL